MIILSCSHKVESFDDEYIATYRTYGDYGQRAIEHASLCKKCYEQVVKDCRLLYTEEEEMEWLNGEDSDEENF